MLDIHIHAATAYEARAVLRELLGGHDDAPANEPASTETEGPPAPTKRRGRKAKEDAAPVDARGEPVAGAETVGVVEASTEPDAEGPSLDEIKAAIMALYEVVGENATFEMLKETGCKNASGVLEAGKSAEVIARCKELIAEAGEKKAAE